MERVHKLNDKVLRSILTKSYKELNVALRKRKILLEKHVVYGPNKITLLHIATNRGIMKRNEEINNKHIIKLLIGYGANPNKADIYGNTPLIHAVKLGKRTIMHTFLKMKFPKIDPTVGNANGMTIYHFASSRGLWKLMESSKLSMNDKVVKQLVRKSTGIRRNFVIYSKAFSRRVPVENWTPLHFAVAECDVKCVNWLLDNGAIVSADIIKLLETYKGFLMYNQSTSCNVLLGRLRAECISNVPSSRMSSRKIPGNIPNSFQDDKTVPTNRVPKDQNGTISIEEYEKLKQKLLEYDIENRELRDTLEKTKEQANVDENKTFTQEKLNEIAKNIGPREFKIFGSHLKFELEELNRIEADNNYALDRILTLLCKWKERTDPKLQHELLGDALDKIDRIDIIRKFLPSHKSVSKKSNGGDQSQRVDYCSSDSDEADYYSDADVDSSDMHENNERYRQDQLRLILEDYLPVYNVTYTVLVNHFHYHLQNDDPETHSTCSSSDAESIPEESAVFATTPFREAEIEAEIVEDEELEKSLNNVTSQGTIPFREEEIEADIVEDGEI